MERSYDVFVDNGLYTLAYYLNKRVEDITHQDIENNIKLMGDKVEEFLDCEKYSNLKSMFLFNSTVSNPSLKHVRLHTALEGFMQEKGNENCMLCGQNHANTSMKLKGRSYLPNRPSATFFNFSNNLHNINICPYCILLTTYSVMNCRVQETVYICNSGDDTFLEDFTKERQEENLQDIKEGAPKSKTNPNRIEVLTNIISKYDSFSSDIELYRFANGKDEKIPSPEIISSNNIKLIRSLDEEGLLEEFKSLGVWMLVNNRLNYKYLESTYDFVNQKLKCSQELFDFLNKEVNTINDSELLLINRIAHDIEVSGINDTELQTKLVNINNTNSFEYELKQIDKIYKDITKTNLFNEDELLSITNPINYIDNRNLLLSQLITNTEGNE